MMNSIQRRIPSIEQLAIMVRNNFSMETLSHEVVISLLRAAVEDFRKTIRNNKVVPPATTETEVQHWILDRFVLKKQALMEQSSCLRYLLTRY